MTNGVHRYAFELRGRASYFVTCQQMTVGDPVSRVTEPVEEINRLLRDPAYSCSVLAYDCTHQWESTSDTHKKFLCFFAIPHDATSPKFCDGDTDPENFYQLVLPSGRFFLHQIHSGSAPAEFVRVSTTDVHLPFCIVERTEFHPNVPYRGP